MCGINVVGGGGRSESGERRGIQDVNEPRYVRSVGHTGEVGGIIPLQMLPNDNWYCSKRKRLQQQVGASPLKS